MSNNLEQQRIADIINNAIARVKDANMTVVNGKSMERFADNRRGAMYALQRFEAAAWYPQVFDEALGERPGAALDFSGGDIQADLDDLRTILERYIELVEEKTGAPAIQNEMFSARSASWYVARQLTRQGRPITFAGIDKHIRANKDLKGKRFGASTIFTRSELDEYVKNFDKLPGRGRPSKKPVEA